MFLCSLIHAQVSIWMRIYKTSMRLVDQDVERRYDDLEGIGREHNQVEVRQDKGVVPASKAMLRR